jgi:hypothetical protein
MAKSMKKVVAKKVTLKKMAGARNVKIRIIYYRQHSQSSACVSIFKMAIKHHAVLWYGEVEV